MGTKKDLTGQRFGKLVVIEDAGQRGSSGSAIWRCRCDCGKEVCVSSRGLSAGNNRSCGCMAIKDLTGKRFGKLTVLKKTGQRQQGYVVWRCICDCGNVKCVRSSSLLTGHTVSCGCKHRKTYTYDNKTQPVREWADCAGISYKAFCGRLKRGQTVEYILKDRQTGRISFTVGGAE